MKPKPKSPKRTASPPPGEISSQAEQPTVEALAIIAAHLDQQQNPDEKLMARAYAYWNEAKEFMRRQQDPYLGRIEHIELPKTFPAKLTEFLRVFAKGKTEADRTKQFRDFCRARARARIESGAEIEVEDGAQVEFRNWKDCGFHRPRQWRVLAYDFQLWREQDLKGKRQASAARRWLDTTSA